MAFAVDSIVIIATIICGIVALFVYHFRRLDLYRKVAKFPGPPTLPIIGNAHYFLGSNADILESFMKLGNSYLSPLRLWLGNFLIIVVQKPEDMKAVLFNPKADEKADQYRFSVPWLGTGLITASHQKWKVHRKLIQPTFNTRILESFVKVFSKQSQVLIEQMGKKLNSGEFDILPLMSLCTLDIVCETAMGVEFNVQTGQFPRFVDSANRLLEILLSRTCKLWLYPDLIFNFTKMGREQYECVQYLHSVTDDVIRKKKENFYNNVKRHNREEAKEQPSRMKPFLDLLLDLPKDSKQLTDQELREEVDTMIIAGNHTTATGNTFAMLMLANYPAVQERVYQELCEIYGDEVSSDVPVKCEDLSRMEYLERVIQETLRLFPVIPLVGRKVSEDLTIGGYTIPKQTIVVLSIINIHRSEKYWPEPLKFDPDRFLPEEVAKRHPYCYTPFSAGPRNCIGMKYAMMSMKALIATVLRRYVVTIDKKLNIEDIRLKLDVALQPANPVMIGIKERDKLSK